MDRTLSLAFAFAALLAFNGGVRGQADEICREYGETPTRESDAQGRAIPFVFGRVIVKGSNPTAKPPRVTVIYSDSSQPAIRQVLSRSGKFCFRRVGRGGTLIVDADGVEVARRQVSDLGSIRHQEDFEIFTQRTEETPPPGVISAMSSRPRNENTIELYRKAAEAEGNQQVSKAIEYVKETVSIDPGDFIAWAKLGSLYLTQNSLTEAAAAFERSLAIRADYTPALLNLGMVRAVQNQYPAAIEIFNRAVLADPASARGWRLLGEAYLQNRQGKLGVLALDRALEIDPIGMAECHLLIARLFDLAGGKKVATREYKAFLKKVPNYPDKKKLEKYIKDNPE